MGLSWDFGGEERPASEAFPVINPYIRILFAGEKGGRRRRLGCCQTLPDACAPAACLACSRQGRVVGVRPDDWCTDGRRFITPKARCCSVGAIRPGFDSAILCFQPSR